VIDDGARLRIERALLRRSITHHLGRERVLEEQLAGFMAQALDRKCDCPAGKALRHLAKELDAEVRPRG
jgi:hypothetical protein